MNERQAFEAWALSQKLGEYTAQMGFRYHDAGNIYPAWQAWQARASLSLPAAGQEPVAWMDDGTLRAGSTATAYRVVTAETKAGMPQATATSFSTPLYAAPQPAVAAGWVMVPIEPTVAQREAMRKGTGMSFSETKIAYSAMLAALPPAPSTEGESNG